MEIWTGSTRISLLPIAVAVLILLLVIMRRRKHRLSYLLCVAIFSSYLLFMIHITLFPFRIDSGFAPEIVPEQFMRSVNLIPFNFDFSFIPDIVVMQIIQNVILTIPFGFGMNFLARVAARHILWLAVGVGLAIETAQLVIALLLVGYAYRVIDINDVLLNALGVLLGYGIYEVCIRLMPRLSGRQLSGN